MSETKRTRIPSKRFPGVYQYESDQGRMWGATVELEPDWRTGKRRTKRKQGFRTQDEAKDWRIAEQDKRRRGDTVEPSMLPFGVWCDEWLAGLTMRPKSVITYQGRLAHMTKRIGDVPLSRITTAMLDRIYVELRAQLSDNYVREIHGATKAVLQRAVDHRMIAQNPARLAQIPAKTHHEAVTWTPAQMQAFLAEAAKDPFWGLVFRFMAETWVRVGELIDLRWDAVDFDAATVRIERTITLDRNRKRISSPPKTQAGRRTIQISRELADWLRRHKDQQRFTGTRTDLVFPSPDSGQWMYQPTVAYPLQKTCERAGVPLVTPHGLRHIGGSLAYAAGVSLKVISERMGHSSLTVTADVYMSVDRHQHRSAADEIGRMLGG